MLRTVVSLLVLCLVVAVAGTPVTGRFSLSLVAMAGALVLGAAALSLRRPPEDDEEPAGEAEVRPLRSSRRPPETVVHRSGGLDTAA